MGALERMLAAQKDADALKARQVEITDDLRDHPKGSPERQALHRELMQVNRELASKNREAARHRHDISREKERDALASMGGKERVSDALQAAAVRTRRLEAVFNAASYFVDGRGDLSALEKAVHKARGY